MHSHTSARVILCLLFQTIVRMCGTVQKRVGIFTTTGEEQGHLKVCLSPSSDRCPCPTSPCRCSGGLVMSPSSLGKQIPQSTPIKGHPRYARHITYPGNGGHQQGLHSDTGVVHFLLGKAGVDHVHNAVNGEGRLGNVGGDNNLSAGDSTLTCGGWRLCVYVLCMCVVCMFMWCVCAC